MPGWRKHDYLPKEYAYRRYRGWPPFAGVQSDHYRDGKLTATTTGNLPTFDLSNYVQESGTVVTTGGIATLSGIKVSGGSLSVDASGSSFWPHGLYACGSIEITGGTIDVKAKGAGGAGLVVTGTGAVDPKPVC